MYRIFAVIALLLISLLFVVNRSYGFGYLLGVMTSIVNHVLILIGTYAVTIKKNKSAFIFNLLIIVRLLLIIIALYVATLSKDMVVVGLVGLGLVTLKFCIQFYYVFFEKKGDVM